MSTHPHAVAISLDDIRPCFEGAIPSMMATCDAEGVPNVAYLSQVDYVDAHHLALSFQFFNTTRRNVLANPQVEILVTHPYTAAMYRIRARYLHTQTSGPLFERMRARLSGIASHTGMSEVFRLKGADLYRVESIVHVDKPDLPAPPAGSGRLSALRRASEQLAACHDLDTLFDTTLDVLRDEFDIRHAMLLMLDASGQQLYTVASRGYPNSGVGSEIALGQGVIGVAARERTPVRISHLTAEYTYSRAVRDGLRRAGAEAGAPAGADREIPWPGLAEPHSQLAVPLVVGGDLLGVVFVESTEDLRFSYDDEDALVCLAGHIGRAVRQFQAGADEPEDGPAAEGPASAAPAIDPAQSPLPVRYFPVDGSVFFGPDYIIKGVAGAILWKLVSDHVQHGRNEFTNRELRLDPRIRLPDVCDNLEARLVLLTRRLVERQAPVTLHKTGRGRFAVQVQRTLVLEEA